MTKEEYLLIREQVEVPIEFFFEYYKEMGGTLNDFNQFTQIFSEMCSKTTTIMSLQPKQISFSTALNRFYDYYNKKFSLY